MNTRKGFWGGAFSWGGREEEEEDSAFCEGFEEDEDEEEDDDEEVEGDGSGLGDWEGPVFARRREVWRVRKGRGRGERWARRAGRRRPAWCEVRCSLSACRKMGLGAHGAAIPWAGRIGKEQQ